MLDYDIYDKYVACPFYVRLRTDGQICCEGVANNSLCVTTFADAAEMKKRFRENCCRDAERCPVYRGIIRAKYSLSPPLPRRPKANLK